MLENETLRLAADKNSVEEVSKIIQERDKCRKQCQEMEKFLKDYGLTWIGNDPQDRPKDGQDKPGGNGSASPRQQHKDE